ncbi:MAG: ABC transporter permease [Dehalococcoidia bacterium]
MNLSILVKVSPLLFLAAFLYIPIVNLALAVDELNSRSYLETLFSVVRDPYYLDVIGFTLSQATVSTILVLLTAMPCCYILSKYEFPGKSIVLALLTVPFIMPPIVLVIALLVFFGPQNPLMNTFFQHINFSGFGNNGSLVLILIAHVIFEFSIVVRLVSNFWSNLNKNITEVASVLGASPNQIFFNVTLPVLKPALIAASSLVFMFTFTSFGVILILGGGLFSTLETEIYYSTFKYLDLSVAVCLSFIQIIFTTLILLIYSVFQTRANRTLKLAKGERRYTKINSKKDFIQVCLFLVTIIIIMSPYLILLMRSFLSDGAFSFDSYKSLFININDSYFFLSPIKVVGNSLLFGMLTVLFSVPLGICVSYYLSKGKSKYKSLIDSFYMSTLGISSVVLGLALLTGLHTAFIDFRTTWIPLVVAHILISYPFVVRIILPTLNSIGPNLTGSAISLGASPWALFARLELPIISRSILVGAVFSFAISMGEFGASLLISRPEHSTIPVHIYRYLSQPGQSNFEHALAMSGILMAIAVAGFIFIEKFRYKGWGDF